MLMRGPESLSDGFNTIKKKIDSDYSASQSIWQTWWTEACLDSRLEAGDVALMADLNQMLPNNNRGSWYFNRVRPLCNMVSGYQRHHRKTIVVVPEENADQQTADQWTKILLNIFRREGIYESVSEAFHHGACVTGMSLLHVYMDYTHDPLSGDIKVDFLPYNCFFLDPYFRKDDLSDCSFIWRRSYLSHTAAASLLPQYYEEIMGLPGNQGTSKDGRFQYMPEAYGQTQQNRLAYDEYYYRDWRKQKLLVDRVTGEATEITSQSDTDIEFFIQNYPQVTVIEQNVPTVRLAILIQNKVFYDGPQPLGIDKMPFVAVTGYYNPAMPYFYSRIQGICRSLRDPQMLLNRRIILSADMLESQVNSGFIFKENAVIDVKHLFQTGQGRIIPIKKDANITDIVPIQPPQVPPSFFQMQETFAKELNAVSGINEELLGAAVDDKAGILAFLRQSAGLITLQPLFDKLDRSVKLLGELIMDTVQSNYTPGKIKNFLEGQDPAPLFYKKAFGKYHCAIEAGLDTETQKQMQFAQMLQLRDAGVPIPAESLLEAATLQNKTKIIETIQQQQQQESQMQQQQSQLAAQEMASRSEQYKAMALANTGLGLERFSRVPENKALAEERKAASIKDDNLALLNLAKALKELDTVDIDQLSKLIQLQRMVEQPQTDQNGSEQIR